MSEGNFHFPPENSGEKKYYYNGIEFSNEAEMLEFIEFCKTFAGDCKMWEETFNRDCPYDEGDCPKSGHSNR